MSYIGSTPITQNFIAGTDQFTGNGSSTNWTLSRFVNSTNDIQVTIANVVQNPTSYSVSGNTLTISPAVSNGTAIYVRYMSTTLQSIAPGQGTVGIAQLSATGTADSTTFLRGDNTWASAGFASGTTMLFAQTAAPTGWTKSTTHDNKALRVVSGTASSGGSVAFTTAFASGLSAGSTTLSTTQIPSHTHTIPTANTGTDNFNVPRGTNQTTAGGSWTSGAQGGGGSHNHTLPSFDVQYVDVIIAVKN